MACAALIGCVSAEWQDVSQGTKIPEGQWHPQAAMVFLSGTGLATYESVGLDLLAARFGPGVAVAIEETSTVDAGRPDKFGGDSLLLRPATLELTALEESNQVSVRVAFEPVTHVVTLHDGPPGCQIIVSIDLVAAEVELEAGRDLAGHIVLIPVGGAGGGVDVPSVQFSAQCSALPGNTLDPLAALIGSAVFGAIESRLTGPFKEELVGIAERLFSVGITGTLETRMVGGDPEPGRFTLALAPNSDDGAEPAMLVSSGVLVTPLRVGLDARVDPCVAHLADLKGVTPNVVTPPVPNLEVYDADVALGVQLNVLRDALARVTTSGGLCRRTAPGVEMRLGTIAPLLAGGSELLATFGPSAEVSIRLRPGAVPTLELSQGEAPNADVTLLQLGIEVFVTAWSTDWLIFRDTADVALTSLTPRLTTTRTSGGTAGTIMIGLRGTYASSGSEGSYRLFILDRQGVGDDDDLAELVRLAVDDVTDDLALFALPADYPYALGDARFERQENHLLMYADFDTADAPTLGDLSAPVRAAAQPPVSSGCAVASRKTSTGAGAVALLFAALLGLWLGWRRSTDQTAQQVAS